MQCLYMHGRGGQGRGNSAEPHGCRCWPLRGERRPLKHHEGLLSSPHVRLLREAGVGGGQCEGQKQFASKQQKPACTVEWGVCGSLVMGV